MQTNEKRRFFDAYLNETGDIRKAVNGLQLYEITIAAGKDLLLSDLNITDYYHFDKAYEIFKHIPTMDFAEIIKEDQQFVELNELIELFNEDEELNTKETIEALDFLKSFASHGKIDCNKLFDEFEKSRNGLINIVAQEFRIKQIAMPKKHEASEDTLQKLPQGMKHQIGSISKFTSQVTRRAFCIMNNDDRILNYHFFLNQSQIVCIMCELLTSNDQPADRNYQNDIYVVLYNTIEEQVITVTMKILDDKYVSKECLLKAGKYIISVQTGHCYNYNSSNNNNSNVNSTTIDEMILVNSDGKLTKHFKMTLMNMFDLFDFDENGKLNREEFNVYNILASDEHVLDQEWEVLRRNFCDRDGEILLKSFIRLHQIEVNNDPLLKNTWMTLMCTGYNEQLDLINNCPCSITIFSESFIHMGQVELREPTGTENEALIDYFWRNGRQVTSNFNVRIWKCDYFAVAIAGPMKLSSAMTIRHGRSKNVLVKEMIEFKQMPLKFFRPKILLQAIATEFDWSLKLDIETKI